MKINVNSLSHNVSYTKKEADIEIIVLYNSSFVDKSFCPKSVRDKGVHVAMKKAKLFDEPEWDYESVKDVLMK